MRKTSYINKTHHSVLYPTQTLGKEHTIFPEKNPSLFRQQLEERYKRAAPPYSSAPAPLEWLHAELKTGFAPRCRQMSDVKMLAVSHQK